MFLSLNCGTVKIEERAPNAKKEVLLTHSNKQQENKQGKEKNGKL